MDASKKAVARLQLMRQGLTNWPKEVVQDDVYNIADKIGCIQIDTINVVERAHYLTFWARLGVFNKQFLYDVAYRERRLFEGWGHAMSYVPMKDWRFFIYSNKERAKDYVVHKGWFSRVDPELFDAVLKRVKDEGPLSSKDFEGSKPSSGWWGWKPAKRALEALFSAGWLMVTRRDGFQRVFDVTERVLPAWVNTSEPDEDERIDFFINRTLRALGVIKPADIRGYYHHWCTKLGQSSKQLQTLLDKKVNEGELIRVSIEGSRQQFYCSPEDATLLSGLEEDYAFEGCRFLNNFDSMMWQADRIKLFFNFQRVLEVYLKPEQRQFGYYTLPILYKDKLVGRIDPKMDRKNKTLIIKGIWYEENFKPTEIFQNEFEKTLANFTKFNSAEKVEYLTPNSA